jgi:pimeloyl-ACP methyl ester carboxylesterase
MIIKYFRLAFKGLLWILGALVASFLVASLFYRDIPAAELEAKWAGPPSQFIEIDGLRVHYRDEGSGPPLVLLHANFANLYMWERWAAELKGRYRVIRFDLSGHGLTGPDASNDYTLERNVKTFGLLLDRLNVQRAVLAGTSVGGTIAMHFAVRHPERVERLILISPGSLESRVRGSSKPPQIPSAVNALTMVTPKALARYMLTSNFGDPTKVDDALVDEWYLFWRREGNRRALLDRLRQYVSGDVEKTIASVKVPVLLLWGEKNRQVPVRNAYEFRKMLTAAPSVTLHVLPGIGHMAVQEAPAETARLVREYLDTARPVSGNEAAASPETPPSLPRSPAS